MATIIANGQRIEIPDDPLKDADPRTKIIWLRKQVELNMAGEIDRMRKRITEIEEHGRWIVAELNKLQDEIESDRK